jgi:hypothetical protein
MSNGRLRAESDCFGSGVRVRAGIEVEGSITSNNTKPQPHPLAVLCQAHRGNKQTGFLLYVCLIINFSTISFIFVMLVSEYVAEWECFN